jgi:hypothetical protein
MAKVTRPLFSDSARGPLGSYSSFRMAPGGPQFIRQARPRDARTPAQLRVRACFVAARAAYFKVPKAYRPTWKSYWVDWLATHPECRS